MTVELPLNRSQPNADALRQALINAKCTSSDGTVVYASMDDVLAALAPAVATGEPDREAIARIIWNEKPDCGGLGKPWPFDGKTPKEIRTIKHDIPAALELCFLYADLAIKYFAALPPAKAAGDVRDAVIEDLAAFFEQGQRVARMDVATKIRTLAQAPATDAPNVEAVKARVAELEEALKELLMVGDAHARKSARAALKTGGQHG